MPKENAAENDLGGDDAYWDAFDEIVAMVRAGDPIQAYELLAGLEEPATELGRRLHQTFRKYLRAMVLLLEDGSDREVEELLQEVLEEAPEDAVFDPWRKQAEALLILQRYEGGELSKDQLAVIREAGFGYRLDQMAILQAGYGLFSEATTALWLGSESQFEAKLARAEARLKTAEREDPKTRDFFRAAWLGHRLVLSILQQADALFMHEFAQVQAYAVQANKQADELKQLHDETAIRGWLSWGPALGEAYGQLANAYAALGVLIRAIVVGQAEDASLDQLARLNQSFLEIEEQAGKLEMPSRLRRIGREPLVGLAKKGRRSVKNLQILTRPSRQKMLSVAGLAATIGFLGVTATLFLIGSLAEVDLSPNLVLGLAGFFGLVLGFGYGALRFENFFIRIFGGGETGADATE